MRREEEEEGYFAHGNEEHALAAMLKFFYFCLLPFLCSYSFAITQVRAREFAENHNHAVVAILKRISSLVIVLS